jgi:DUF971 family protein
MNTPTRVEVEGRSTVRLTWGSGAVHELTAAQLRLACACATCLGERDRRTIRLTVVGAEPTVDDARLVGDYGIAFTFGPDGHRTGIFRWDQLEAMGHLEPGSG